MDGVSEVRESREGRRRGREGNEKEGREQTEISAKEWRNGIRVNGIAQEVF